jgi:hypothetical protein
MNLREKIVRWGGRNWVRLEDAEAAVEEVRELLRRAEAKLDPESGIDPETVGQSFEHKKKVIGALVMASTPIVAFLEKTGLRNSDFAAMLGKTLWGQEVANHLFAGVLWGLKRGVETLNQRREEAYNNVSAWLEADDA